MEKSILVTGGQGQVGTALRQLGSIAGFPIVAPTRDQLDLLDPAAIEQAVGPEVAAVINCAAFTEVDAAESAEPMAFALNATAPERLANACNRFGIPLIHLSTDYVFDGRLDRPMVESDPVAPKGAYGRSKAEGERLILAAGGPHLILRTAWVVSPWRKNFVKTMLRLAAERDELRVVDDQWGCPTGAQDIAQAIAQIVPQLLAKPAPAPTILHLVNQGEASWFGLARFVMDQLQASGRRNAKVVPIPTSDYPTPAARPANSRLSTEALRERFGVEMRPWQVAVGEVVAQCLADAGEVG